MCEWLSNAEWCDVQLLCKGRVFSAHRAVLASVSCFMRKILQSCSEENTPTIIVLPDFDVKAMFSVLYYIYNGEVVVPKSNLEYFVDIIITLEIYVDKHFLNIIQPNIQGFDNKLARINASNKEVIKEFKPENRLKLQSDNDFLYVTIRKRQTQIKQGSANCVDLGDTALYCNQAQQQRPYLENKHSQHGDRQKKSFLRDSFIGTYPRNGNVNGHDTGVPAISNELYLDKTSGLLTNANGIDHRLTDALSAASTKTDHMNQTNRFNHSSTHIPQSLVLNMDEKLFDCVSLNARNTLLDKSSTFISSAPSRFVEHNTTESKMSAFLDLTTTRSYNNLNKIPHVNSLYQMQSIGSIKKVDKHFEAMPLNISRKNLVKAISNQVMQSPWCPRLPLNYKPIYKPFRRKVHNKKDEDENKEIVGNDKNNNTKSSLELSGVNLDILKYCSSDHPEKSTSTSIIDKATTTTKTCISKDISTSQTKSLSSSARFTCPECGKTFSQLRNFKYHMSVHRGTREFAATCTVCGKYFNDRGYLSSHMKIHRNRKEYKCQLCPKSFNQRVAYNMHVRIHTGVKPHVCDECGKAFSRKMLLKQHQRTHSGERPYACPHCDKRFADRSNMTLHLRLHTGVKPFSCTLCPKSFTKKHHLKSHLNYHTGAKPYSCPKCLLGFTQSSNMRTHLKKCTVPLPEVYDSGSATT